MAREIYLLGGGNQSDYLKLDKKIADYSKNKSIFAINLTTDDKIKLETRKQELLTHFRKVGYNDIKFASDSKNIKLDINNADVLFICGGDTELLLRNITENKLSSVIKSFKGVIEGNSAGAYVCCDKYIKIKEEVKEINGLGLVKINCKAHYNKEFDNNLLELSKKEDIYAIAEKAAIIVESSKFNYLNDVYLFSNKQKRRIN